MSIPHFPRTRYAAFTLIELLSVISIIALLATLLFPAIGGMVGKADNTKCMSNLRQVGIALLSYASDNENKLPLIETDPTNPVYTPEAEAKTLAQTLEKYGVTNKVLECPGDVRAKLCMGKGSSGTSFFAAKTTSYEWRPTFDGELVSSPKVYTPRGSFAVPPSRVRVACDYVVAGEAPHLRSPLSSSYNNLYLTGEVRAMEIRKGEATR